MCIVLTYKCINKETKLINFANRDVRESRAFRINRYGVQIKSENIAKSVSNKRNFSERNVESIVWNTVGGRRTINLRSRAYSAVYRINTNVPGDRIREKLTGPAPKRPRDRNARPSATRRAHILSRVLRSKNVEYVSFPSVSRNVGSARNTYRRT